MRKGRINKRRIAPRGYTAIDINFARELYNRHIEVTFCGNNINSYHIFNGWCLGYTPTAECMDEQTFQDTLNNFLFYLEPEIGTYPVFYTLTENVETKGQSNNEKL